MMLCVGISVDTVLLFDVEVNDTEGFPARSHNENNHLFCMCKVCLVGS